MSSYPYRECQCGKQIHVGSRQYCDDCYAALDNGQPLDMPFSSLTKREWFAGMALMGFTAGRPDGKSLKPEQWAEASYAQADAMIAEGQKK